jgi:hypothetical protein
VVLRNYENATGSSSRLHAQQGRCALIVSCSVLLCKQAMLVLLPRRPHATRRLPVVNRPPDR